MAVVTSGADTGPGTLRAALATGAGHIVLAPSVQTVSLLSPLSWSGASLVLLGRGQVVDGGGTVGTLLEVAGANVRISGLDLRNTIGSGIRVAIPPTATGTATVDLIDVTVANTALHGVHVDDLSGSSASVQLRMVNAHVLGAGAGESDQDGVRVDERGEGGITFLSSGSTYEASGADGVELDEGGSGDVVLDIVNSDFLHNGPLDGTVDGDGLQVDEAGPGDVDVTVFNSTLVDKMATTSTWNRPGTEAVSSESMGPSWDRSSSPGLLRSELRQRARGTQVMTPYLEAPTTVRRPQCGRGRSSSCERPL